MAKKRSKKGWKASTPAAKKGKAKQFCSMPVVPEREFSADVSSGRLALIRRNGKKWANGTVLHYHFLERPRAWRGRDAEKKVVRDAFKKWKDVGIGLEFEEVDSASEAEIRIGFLGGDGAWSYVGRDVLQQGPDERTMNFGWDITRSGEIDTAIHEIGHTLGFPHEHQNPIAGIVWNEEAVYEALARPPNEWSREATFYNIIRKIDADAVQGSVWDPDSIMHYPFEAGLIEQPTRYQSGLTPAPGLSDRDKKWVSEFYPSLDEDKYKKLLPLQSVRLKIAPGEQQDFLIEPDETRYYTIQTFGASDTVMVLFEDINGQLRYRAGDDDSGLATNARIRLRMYKGQKYILRLRLYYRFSSGNFGLMMW